MKRRSIQEAMEEVHIRAEMQEEIIENLSRMQKGRSRMRQWKKMAAAAAVVLVAAGIISIPVQAGIRHLIQARMESMPQEELESLTEMMESQQISGDSFSREYFRSERERMIELFKAYQSGTFPEKEMILAENGEQIPQDVLCYEPDTGYFYLPDREMTDEELLEIIDFNYKKDYVLAQDEAVQAYREAQEKEEEQVKAAVLAEGGISEEKAMEIAKNWMEPLFGTTSDGMEEHQCLAENMYGVRAYQMTFDIRSNCYYYLTIDAADGSLVAAFWSAASLREREEIEAAQAEARMDETLRAAADFLEDKLGIREEYANIYCLYTVVDGKVGGNNVKFYFVKEDGSADRIELLCDTNDFFLYQRASYEDYQEVLAYKKKKGADVKTVVLQ